MRKERKGKRIYRGENEATGNENTKEIVMLWISKVLSHSYE
jgi:hypothetical protein